MKQRLEFHKASPEAYQAMLTLEIHERVRAGAFAARTREDARLADQRLRLLPPDAHARRAQAGRDRGKAAPFPGLARNADLHCRANAPRCLTEALTLSPRASAGRRLCKVRAQFSEVKSPAHAGDRRDQQLEPDRRGVAFRNQGMKGKTVAILEARSGAQLAELVRRRGGTPFLAPALAEVPDMDRAFIAHGSSQELWRRTARGGRDLPDRRGHARTVRSHRFARPYREASRPARRHEGASFAVNADRGAAPARGFASTLRRPIRLPRSKCLRHCAQCRSKANGCGSAAATARQTEKLDEGVARGAQRWSKCLPIAGRCPRTRRP